MRRNGGILLLALMTSAGCGRQSGIIDRTFEDGIEVVHNHLVPYKVLGEPGGLVLEEDFRIDTERPELAAAGLTDIRSFAVDSRGYIYAVQHPRRADLLLVQFDGRGILLKAFGKKGQGPGELQWPTLFSVNSRDELSVWDSLARRTTVFDASANLVRESAGRTNQRGGLPLENGNYLAWEPKERPDGRTESIDISIVSGDFETRRVIETFRPAESPASGGRIDAFPFLSIQEATRDRIYLGVLGSAYEILVLDLDGRPLRKIRKDYHAVPFTAEDRSAFVARVVPKSFPNQDGIIFPSLKPAYQAIFADETGRLFVVTSERDSGTGQSICDLFNRDGVFIGRRPIGYSDILRQYWESIRLDVVARFGRIYTLKEKDNGFKELIVYEAIWR